MAVMSLLTSITSMTLATLALLAIALPGAAWSQDDPPGRVGRVAGLQGGVLWYDHEQGRWVEAERNRPVTRGDRLSTAAEGRVELRVGSTVLRLASASELEVLRLDDERMSFQLHSGSLALRVRSREVAGEIDIVTVEARLQPQRSGHYRIDRIDDTTQAGSWRGDMLVEGAAGFVIATGQRAELWRQAPRGELRQLWTTLSDDEFSRWVARDDSRDERTASTRFVSPEMTGAEELDRAGRWDRHPDHGAIWFPVDVRPGWAPYRYGRWAWVRPWGWSWVDEAPWGFAPFHYGRWTSWNGRWGWVPGVYEPRPIFAPGLVAWVGGPGVGVSIHLRGPVVGWVPLAPRDVYVPTYRHSPRHRDRINGHAHDGAIGPQRPHFAAGPPSFGNQAVPGAVTVVPREVLDRRGAVGREAAEWRERQRGAESTPLVVTTPPPGPQAVSVLPQGVPVGPNGSNGSIGSIGSIGSMGSMRPPPRRDDRAPAAPLTVPGLVPSAVPMQVAPPSPGDVMSGPPRPRADPPFQVEPRRDRSERSERDDRVERTDRADRVDRIDRADRLERVDRAGPGAPAWRAAPAAPVMATPAAQPAMAAPQPAAPQPTPRATPQAVPQAVGPARPAAPPAAAPPPAAPADERRPPPGERERGREREAAGVDSERKRGTASRETESQR